MVNGGLKFSDMHFGCAELLVLDYCNMKRIVHVAQQDGTDRCMHHTAIYLALVRSSLGIKLRRNSLPRFEKHLQKLETPREKKTKKTKKKNTNTKQLICSSIIFSRQLFSWGTCKRIAKSEWRKRYTYMNSLKQGTSWSCFHVLSWCWRGWGRSLGRNQLAWEGMGPT